jgi:hypothetical protein
LKSLSLNWNERYKQNQRYSAKGNRVGDSTHDYGLPALRQCLVLTPELVRPYPASLRSAEAVDGNRLERSSGTLAKPHHPGKLKFTTT